MYLNISLPSDFIRHLFLVTPCRIEYPPRLDLNLPNCEVRSTTGPGKLRGEQRMGIHEPSTPCDQSSGSPGDGVRRDRNEDKHPGQSVRSKASEANQRGRGTVSPRQPSSAFYTIPNGMNVDPRTRVDVTPPNVRISYYRDSTSTSPFNPP